MEVGQKVTSLRPIMFHPLDKGDLCTIEKDDVGTIVKIGTKPNTGPIEMKFKGEIIVITKQGFDNFFKVAE
jgi:hypothetical protein